MEPKLLSYLLTSLIILPLPLPATLSQTNPNPSHLAQTETATPATINGKLDSNSQTREDKTYYNIHTLEGKEGEQITIELTSSEFTPRLYLFNLVEIIQYKPFNAKGKWEKPHYAAYILHPTGEPKWVDLGEAEPINQAVKEFRNTLKNPNTDIKPIARTLHGLLIQPILPLLGNTHSLLISPDSQLNLIPFAALVDQNNQYLVENYAITYLTTGRDLLRLQNRGESQTQPIAIANPDYDNPGDPASVRIIARNPSQENRGVASDNRGLGNSTNDEWTPLTATKEEAAAIIPLLNNPLLLEGKDATENALKQSFRPQILHIATHGFFKPDLAEVAPP